MARQKMAKGVVLCTDAAQGDTEYRPSSEDSIDLAKECGLQVVFPEDTELQVVIDTEEAFVVFQRMWKTFQLFWPASYIVAPSKSGLPRRHVVVTMAGDRKLDPWMRIALQASLGSDPMRELMSCCRAWDDDMHPTFFFEKE